MSTYTRIEDVPLFKYGMIICDPPWTFKLRSDKGKAKSAQAQYKCAPLDWIKSLPVRDLADKDCVLWLWATNPMLPQALETMQAWGFTFKTAGHWSKKTVTGKQAFGTGYILRGAGEPFLIGTIGRPRFTRSVRSVIEAPVGRHSQKPEAAFSAAEKLCPDVLRLELFSRQARDGWDVMGDEVEERIDA